MSRGRTRRDQNVFLSWSDPVRFGLWILLATSASKAWADPATRARFLADYPAAAKKIEATYSRLRITCETEFSAAGRKSGPAWAHYLFVADQGRMRIDREFTPNSGHSAGEKSAFIVNGKESYIVDRNANSSSFRLRGRLPQSLRATSIFPPAVAPYSIDDDRVVDLLAKRGFEIEEATTQGSGDDEMVVVRWNWPWEGTGPTARQGEFCLMPNRGWVLKSHHWRQRLADMTWNPLDAYAEFQYRGELDGVPLLAGEDRWSQRNDGSKLNEGLWRITAIAPAAAAAGEFTLAAFGLKYEQGVSTRNYGWLLVLLGAVGLMGSLATRRWLNRRPRNVTAQPGHR